MPAVIWALVESSTAFRDLFIVVDFVIFGLVVAESRFVDQLLLSSFSFNDNEVCVESLLE